MKLLILFSILLSNSQAPAISIMSYNVLNLFDAEHDLGKNDFEFLPNDSTICDDLIGIESQELLDICYERINRIDWTNQKIDIKIDQIKKAVLSYNNKLPDILTLSEVENANVVELLQFVLGYDGYVMTTSPDKRGIDVALLYKESDDLVLFASNELKLKMGGVLTRATRNILDVEFAYKGESLHILVNHWPSQAAPTKVRLEVASQAGKYIDKVMAKNPSANFVVTGDFNTTKTDIPSPIKSIQKRKYTNLRNMHFENKLQLAFDGLDDFFLGNQPIGTYYYFRKDVWNMLDLFLTSESLHDGVGIEADVYSYAIVHKGLSKTIDNKDGFPVTIPWRYNHRADNHNEAGFSDHYPIYMEVK